MCSGILLISLSRIGGHHFVQRLKLFLMLDDGLCVDLHSWDLDVNSSPFPRTFGWKNNNMHHFLGLEKNAVISKNSKQVKTNIPSTGFSLSCSSCSCTAVTQLVWISSPSLFRSAMDLSTSSESRAMASSLDTERSAWLFNYEQLSCLTNQCCQNDVAAIHLLLISLNNAYLSSGEPNFLYALMNLLMTLLWIQFNSVYSDGWSIQIL